ncbi:uncharacterized protein LOC134844289 [Symsagittifera roscoffensis]|uniref:uncharacterized protein LOC134844289 n=1 Tax=Symsagittifera roscoffensis TaxID=84072 RepID=UPI00307C97DA
MSIKTDDGINSGDSKITGGRAESLGHVGLHTEESEMRSVYDRWAESFEKDIEEDVKYVGHLSLAKVVQDYYYSEVDCLISQATDDFNEVHISSVKTKPTDGVDVLDIGAGTGLVATALVPFQFRRIDALDLSREMLAQAKSLGLYSRCIQASLNEPLPLDECSYDLVVCAGTFTLGHVTAHCIPNVLKVMRPGALFVFGVREDLMETDELKNFYGFPHFLNQLEKETQLKVEERRDNMPYHLLAGKSFNKPLHHTIFVCRRI